MRQRDAGVSLIEMLVVLALFGVVAGAVVLNVPDRPGARHELPALTVASDLTHAVDRALATSAGFAVQVFDTRIAILERADDGSWIPHSDRRLAQAKLFPGLDRIPDQDGLFVVSRDLVPENAAPLVLRFRGGIEVAFDGLHAHVTGRW